MSIGQELNGRSSLVAISYQIKTVQPFRLNRSCIGLTDNGEVRDKSAKRVQFFLFINKNP